MIKYNYHSGSINEKEDFMSIKQGEFLKELRIKNNLSQEKLGEILGVSRQSVSKWEQGYALPDTENLVSLSRLYNISVDAILNCDGEKEAAGKPEKKAVKKEKEISGARLYEAFAKRGWFFWSYPFVMIFAYVALGLFAGSRGWSVGWIVFLTIPIYYSAIFAKERKNPLIFAYPFVAAIIFLIFGFVFQMWHPMWIVFLTIPIYYIMAFSKKKSK